MRRVLLVALAALALLLPGGPALAQSAPPAASTDLVEPLVLAHYYIWFTPGSWDRAKTDTPAVGRYSSDDVGVVREQVRQAKAVGIDGFIVSWKSSPVLDARLATLVQVARELDFKLALTYQGLDFARDPLPLPRIATDLAWFARTYGSEPVFSIFDKPMVVLTGTPVLAPADVAALTAPLRKDLLVLASDKSAESYERIAGSVDGDLYYWSSVNPQTFDGHAEKLQALGRAVRAHGGIWVAPVAPGFDARLVGGTSRVDRRGGQTLRDEWAAAMSSQPTAIGVISWNEYSENTHVEPSRREGNSALRTLATLTGADVPGESDGDSSGPSGDGSPVRAVLALGGLAGLFLLSAVLLVRRRGRPAAPPEGPGDSGTRSGTARVGAAP